MDFLKVFCVVLKGLFTIEVLVLFYFLLWFEMENKNFIYKI